MASSEPLKFCIVTTFYPPYNFGGDGIYAHRLANGLASLGHHVTVLHSPTAYQMVNGGPPPQPYRDHPNVVVRPIRTPLRRFGLLAVQQFGSPCFQRAALKRWLDRGDFDVIHFNNVSLLGGPHVFRYGKALKLCTLIEHWLVCPMHVLWKMDREVCTKPSCLRCTLHGRRPPQLWRYTGLMRRATRSIDAFIGPSLFTMQMHRERGLHGTMVQLPLFHPEPTHVPQPKQARPYFLFVGRLEKIKGVQDILPLFKTLPKIDLIIAGDGTYAAELRRDAAGATNVHFLGSVNHARLQSLYRGAVATIVPSLCCETFGVVVAESFSTSTPVIVRAQSSLKEIVDTHGGGLTYTNDEELRCAVSTLIDNRALRDDLGRNGRVAYDSEFAEAPFLRHYEAVVRDLLQSQRNHGPTVQLTGDPPRLADRPVLLAHES